VKAFLLLLCLYAVHARAQESVDLLLVLAVDASGSIDDREFRLQREGYAEALTSSRVLSAIRSGSRGAIAVAMVEWGAPAGAATVVPWMRVGDAASAERLANAIRTAPRSPQSWNAIGDAIDHSAALIGKAPFRARRKVIDVSGDGPDMRSVRPVAEARASAVAAGITVNALAVLGGEARANIDRYYREEVIGGPGAFVVTARDRRELTPAILHKLEREIAGVQRPGRRFAAASRAAPLRATPLPVEHSLRAIHQDRDGR
jgi:hypothetical protein